MPGHHCILGGPQQRGTKFRSGCLTPVFPEAQKRAEMLCHPCIIGGPHQTETKIQKWMTHPCLVRGPKARRNAVSPLHSWGSPPKGKEIQN